MQNPDVTVEAQKQVKMGNKKVLAQCLGDNMEATGNRDPNLEESEPNHGMQCANVQIGSRQSVDLHGHCASSS